MSEMMAFTAQQTARLAGISDRMLKYWEDTDVFFPEYITRRSSGPFRRIYTFKDLVNLRTLAILRTKDDIKLEELRQASDYLRKFSDSPWSELAIRVFDQRVVFRHPHTGEWQAADGSGQLVMVIQLEDVRKESEQLARESMRRGSDHYGRFERNRYVMSNAWVFAGTRIPVSAILELMDADYGDERILALYPTLRATDLEAVRAFEPPAEAA